MEKEKFEMLKDLDNKIDQAKNFKKDVLKYKKARSPDFRVEIIPTDSSGTIYILSSFCPSLEYHTKMFLETIENDVDYHRSQNEKIFNEIN